MFVGKRFRCNQRKGEVKERDKIIIIIIRERMSYSDSEGMHLI